MGSPSKGQIRISLLLQTQPPEQTAPEYKDCKASLEQNVKDALLQVDSHRDCPMEWDYIQRVWDKLQTLKETPRIRNLLDMIHPVMAKYGRVEELPSARRTGAGTNGR